MLKKQASKNLISFIKIFIFADIICFHIHYIIILIAYFHKNYMLMKILISSVLNFRPGPFRMNNCSEVQYSTHLVDFFLYKQVTNNINELRLNQIQWGLKSDGCCKQTGDQYCSCCMMNYATSCIETMDCLSGYQRVFSKQHNGKKYSLLSFCKK